MKLLDAISESFSARRKTARQQYVGILQRADDPRRGDAELLEKLMEQLDLSPDDVRADLAVIERVRELEPIAADLEPRRAAHKQSSRDREAFGHEYEEAVRALAAKRDAVEKAVNTALAAFGESAKADAELRELRTKHGDLLA